MPTPARFVADVLQNINNRTILDHWEDLALPDGWLVAGCLFQTIWNLQTNQAPDASIKDYDLFYYDPSDTSEEAEQKVQRHADHVLRDLGARIEVTNQARVHLWYESYFGYPCKALCSSADGIDRFLIPATCVGVRPGEIYAPNGLDLVYSGVLTMNPLTPHRDLFQLKAQSYFARWPSLRIVMPDDTGVEIQ